MPLAAHDFIRKIGANVALIWTESQDLVCLGMGGQTRFNFQKKSR